MHLRSDRGGKLRAPHRQEIAVEVVEPRIERHHIDSKRRGSFGEGSECSASGPIAFARDIETAKRRGKFECREMRSEEHTSELQSLMRISYAVFCLKKKK